MTQHSLLAAGRWHTLSLAQQLGNIGSEMSRAARWQGKDTERFEGAVARAFELLDLTLQDPRWKHRLKEIARLREAVADAYLGGTQYRTSFQDLDSYLMPFALLARL